MPDTQADAGQHPTATQHANAADQSAPPTHTHADTRPATSGSYSDHRQPRYYVELFAGTATALQYHALDPTAKLLAIDNLSPTKFRRLLPPHLRNSSRIHYVQRDLTDISPTAYANILHKWQNITPSQVTHCHASPPCETLSIASREKEAVPHYVNGRPNSPLAQQHHHMLANVLHTLHTCHPHRSGTAVTVENPVGRMRRLPIVKHLLRQPGWRTLTTNHCMLASHLDTDPTFAQKPTTWLYINAHPHAEHQDVLCKRDNCCRCSVPGTKLHRRVICRPPSHRPLQPGQSVHPNDASKSRVPLGAYQLFLCGTIPPIHAPPSQASDTVTDLETACPSDAVQGTTEVDKGAIHVDAQLIPPSHDYKLDPLSPRILWHRRFGHAQSPRLDRTADYVAGLTRHKSPNFCECCIRAKLRKKNASKDPATRPAASAPLGQVSADLVEFTVHKDETLDTIDGYRYACVFVDGYSRYKHVFLMKTKDQSLDALKDFIRRVGKPKQLLTDKDKVFVAGQFARYCLDNCIDQLHSPAYRASFNGLIERSNKEVKDIARSMLLDSGLPPQFWGHALRAACYTSNRISGRHGPTPFELMTPVSHGLPPDVSNLRVFGSPCFSYVEKQHRLAANYHAHAERGIFVGYDANSPSYECYIPARKGIFSRHEVVCDESFDSGLDVLLGKYVKDVDDIVEFHAITSVPTKPRRTTQQNVDQLFRPSPSIGPAKRLNDQNDRILIDTCQSTAKHIRERCAAINGKSFNEAKRMLFRTSDKPNSKRSYYNKTDFLWDIKHGHLQFRWTPVTTDTRAAVRDHTAAFVEEQAAMQALFTGAEPIDRREALQRTDWPEWQKAEQTEWQELEGANTFTWVPAAEPRDANKQVISSKFVYKQKPDRKKARICARGFLQHPHEVGNRYAPVCRQETIRCMLALAQRFKWAVRGFDIRNAYVQAPVSKPVYISPPDGYKREGQVLRLNRALYGLPGSGRAWYKTFDRYMRSIHFKPSAVDPCLYVHSSKQVFVCSYVDDCCVIGDTSLVPEAVSKIKLQYKIRDLGFPANFLGMQLTRTPDYLEVSCQKFCESLLDRFKIASKLVTTPLPSTSILTSFDHSDTKPCSSRYRQMVGCINFAANSARPDVASAAHQLARHLNNPSHAHESAAVRTIQYLHCTSHIGLRYKTDMNHPVITFSDSDWAGCIDTRQSTSGRVTMMQGAAVIWSSCRQKSIALSSAEAEMVAMNSAARDTRFVRRLHASIGLTILHPTPLMVDNAAALQWAAQKAKWSASRHISTQHFNANLAISIALVLIP